MLRKVYIRWREDVPENPNCYAALDGFRKLGVETAPFYGFGDVEKLPDLGPEVGVHGFIGDVMVALDTIGRPRPIPLDYPQELAWFLGRNIRRGRLSEAWLATTNVFVKPVEQKLFTGYLATGSVQSNRRAIFPGDTPVWLSEPVSFRAESRCFVLEGELIDVRPYKGRPGITPEVDLIGRAIENWRSAPRAFALDFGVTSHGATLLVEANDAYALGHYGLDSVSYARMISARWEELTQ